MTEPRRTPIGIKAVAQLAGVSVATVSRVLNDSGPVSEELRKRVLHVIDEAGYQPNLLARGLRTQQSGVIGLVLPSVSNEHFSGITRALQDYCSHHGFTVLVSNSDGRIENEVDAMRTLAARRVDGIALVSSSLSPTPALEDLLDRGVPMVAIDRAISEVPIDQFLVDIFAGTRDAVLHLAGQGRQRIAFAAGPTRLWTAKEKLRGYRDGIRRAGLSAGPILPGDHTLESGIQQARSLLALDPRPDAVIFANNVMALGGLQVLMRSDVRIPEELAIINFDDAPWTNVVRPSLSVIAQPIYEMGRLAAEALVRRINSPDAVSSKTEVLPTRFVERESTAAATR